MIHQIFNLTCCDSIAPFSNYGAELYTERNDCLPRSVKVSQMIDSEMNFGMVYYYNPTRAEMFSDSMGGWNFMYGFHLWTEKNGYIYESCRQWETLFKTELETNNLVMMMDISHYKRPKTKTQHKLMLKDIRKKLDYALSKKINYVYLCGSGITFLDDVRFRWYDWDFVNGEIDYAEERVSNFENNLVTS